MSVVAKSSITLTSVSDAYYVSLAPDVCVIHANFDGTHPILTNAYTLITVNRGEVNIPFSIERVSTTHQSIVYDLSKIDAYTYKLSLIGLHNSILEGGIDITVKCNNTKLSDRFTFTVERESTMLDWIQEWDSNKTSIGGDSIITPRLFVGKKITGQYDSLNDIPGLTGVYIGPNENDSCGVYGYKNSVEIFHLDETGGKIGGWDIQSEGLYSANGKMQVLSDGSIRALGDTHSAIWSINADGSATFSRGNVNLNADGSAEFNGQITSTNGEIGGWAIKESLLHCIPIALSSVDKYIAVANVSHYPILDGKWNGNHFDWVKKYGGVAMYHKSLQDFGFVAYSNENKMVFSAGTTNSIAGWSFDESAIWIGNKNNNVGMYTHTSGSITIGTNGLRGFSWYIDTNGSASFVKGLVTFGDISGNIVGWTLKENKIATDSIALTSAVGSSGLYLTSSKNGNFVELGPDAMEKFITSYGGVFLKVGPQSAILSAYSEDSKRLFRINSNGVCYIAGWQFDNTTLYTGDKVTSGFANSGFISIGPSGLRGHKWRLEDDGSGALAGGHISWDSSGNVTLDNSVKITIGNLDGTIIDSDGIFTGKISADNITVGTISTASLVCQGKWSLNQDGSGYLANKNISWDTNGALTINSKIISNEGSIGGFKITEYGIFSENKYKDNLSLGNFIKGSAFALYSNGRSAFLSFTDDMGRQACIGLDCLPSTTGAIAVGVLENDYSHIIPEGKVNIALKLSATNAEYNYAYCGNGNGVLNGFMAGYKLSKFTLRQANAIYMGFNISPKYNNKWLIRAATSGTGVLLPDSEEVRKALLANKSEGFALEFEVTADIDSVQFKLYGKHLAVIGNSPNQTMPWFGDNEAVLVNIRGRRIPYVTMNPGDHIRFMLIYDPEQTRVDTNTVTINGQKKPVQWDYKYTARMVSIMNEDIQPREVINDPVV